jgi:hypothetical protein
VTDLGDWGDLPRSGIAIPVEAITQFQQQGGTWEELLVAMDQWVADVDSPKSPAIRWELPSDKENGDA